MTDIREAGTLTKTGGRWLIQAISPGQGSSGNYPQEVLEAAGRDRVFPAGTMMMVDHATEAQDWERPEGSIKDLAGVLTEDARWDDNLSALVAEAKIFEHWRPILESMRDEIGISIRASGEVEEADGGRIVKRLVEGRSIDFVTRAGRGGRVLEVLESQRPSTLDEIAEIFRPNTPASAPAEEDHIHSTTKEAADMADTNAETSRVDEADPKKPNPFAKGNDSGSGGGNGNETEVEKLRRENDELKAEIKRLKAQGAKEARRHEVAGIVEEAFENIDAPATKDALIESFTASDKDAEQIVKEAKTFADELTFAPNASGSVRGLGESRPVVTESDDTPITFADLEALKGA